MLRKPCLLSCGILPVCIAFGVSCTGVTDHIVFVFNKMHPPPANSVLPRPFSEGGTPCRFLVTPCPFQEAEMTPCPFLGDAQRRPVTFYLTPNVTVHGNRRGNYAARTFPLFYSTAFIIVIRLVYKNLRYWPIRIYFGRLAIDCCINFIQ